MIEQASRKENLSAPQSGIPRLSVGLIFGIIGWGFLLLLSYTALENFGSDMYGQLSLICLGIPLILFVLGIYLGVRELRKNNLVIDKLSPGLIINIVGLSVSLPVILLNVWGWINVMSLVIPILVQI